MDDDGQQLEASVRQQPRAAIIELHGEINAFAEAALNAAYAEAEAAAPSGDPAQLQRRGLHQQHRYRPDRRPAGARARRERRLLACGLSEHYVEIFTITRLADYMTVFPTRMRRWPGLRVTRCK